MSVTREAELAMLIAEQGEDDARLSIQWGLSLDRAFDASDQTSGTLHDVIGRDLWGQGVGVRDGTPTNARPTIQEHFYWKYLRNKHGWSYPQIAARTGVPARKIRYWVSQPYHFNGTCFAELSARFDVLAHTYMRGARLMDIAEDVYADAGYATPGACYVSLHVLFTERGVGLRPGRWKHGMRSREATLKQTHEYYNQRNAEKRAMGLSSRGTPLRKCVSRTRFNKPCRRFAIEGKETCVVHSFRHPTLRWTEDVVVAALRSWRVQHGSWPTPKDWEYTADAHPNFKTVYARFGSWPRAIEVAAIRER